MRMHRPSSLRLAISIFVALFALSAVTSVTVVDESKSTTNSLAAILSGVALYFLVVYGARQLAIARFIAHGATIVATAVTLYFVSQFAYFPYPETTGALRGFANLTSVLSNLHGAYIHPNDMASLLEMMLPLCLGLLFGLDRDDWRRWGLLLCAMTMVYAVLLTSSRGAWAGLGITVLLHQVIRMHGRSRRQLIGAGIASASVIALAFLMAGHQFALLAPSLETLKSRLVLYTNALYLIRDYFYTGVGGGDGFQLVYSRFALLDFVPFLSYPHNLLLAVWFAHGLVGVMAFVVITTLFYSYVALVVTRSHRFQGEPLFYGAAAGVTATLIHGLSDARQYAGASWVLSVLFLGIGLTVAAGAKSLSNTKRDDARPTFRSPRMVVSAGVAGFLALVAFAIGLNEHCRALWYTNQGALSETRADVIIWPDLSATRRMELGRSAQHSYEKALEIEPRISSANRRLGNLLVGRRQFASAIPLLETAAAQEPANPAAIKGLGLAYVWAGRLDDGISVLRRLADRTHVAQELVTWHQYWSTQKQPLLAAYALEASIFVASPDGSSDIRLWLLVGDAYREGHEEERARAWYEKVLEREPDNERANRGLDALRNPA